MDLLALQIESWDQVHYAEIPEFDVKVGDQVIFHLETGTDLALVVGKIDMRPEELRGETRKVLRLATSEDRQRLESHHQQKLEIFHYCQQAVEKLGLEMKLVDNHIAIDGSRIIFGFIAEGRVDFRELVKDLTHHFQKTIRLQQMGIRDEARLCGDIGPCGRELCCRRFLHQLASVTSDYAKIQGVEHRGCERLSGVCGRLKCCLSYELIMYQELAQKLPAVGTTFKTPQGSGTVISQNVLRQSVNVQLEQNKIVEVPAK